jgi:glycerophosphoryl diester phosphodiesterase
VRVLAHRGNRLHAPENTRIALVSAYTAGAGALELDVQLTKDGRLVVSHDPTTKRLAGENHAIIETDLAELRKLDVGETFKPRGATEFHYRRPEKPGDQIETFPHLLGDLPADVPKVVELKHDSSLETGRRDEFVKKTCDAIAERFKTDQVVLYSKDPENLRLAREQLPGVRVAAFDWELSPEEQVALVEQHDTDGVVIELGAILGADGALTEAGKRLEQLHADRGLRVGAIVYLYRDPAVFTREEYEALRGHDFVWSLATDSMLDVQPFVRGRQELVKESFAGTETNTRQFSLGYAKANEYAHVRQEDGVHVDISEYHGKLKGDSELEEGVWYALRDWPFYSGGGLGYVDGIEGDFAAEVSYEASRVGQASTLEMAAVNVPPAAHRGPVRADGSRFVPGERDKSNFFDPHGAPPFAGVEHDEDDGYRINSNSGTAYDNNWYGRPVGDGTALAGRLRLERRGPYFSAYYRNDNDAPDWVCVGVARNDSLNERVFLRCAGKRWRQELEDDPTKYHPVVPVSFTFRDFEVTRFHDGRDGVADA